MILGETQQLKVIWKNKGPKLSIFFSCQRGAQWGGTGIKACHKAMEIKQ